MIRLCAAVLTAALLGCQSVPTKDRPVGWEYWMLYFEIIGDYVAAKPTCIRLGPLARRSPSAMRLMEGDIAGNIRQAGRDGRWDEVQQILDAWDSRRPGCNLEDI